MSWVLVPAVVRDRRGPIRDLQREDFHLKVDGRKVPIAGFEQGGQAPVSLIYLQDLSGSIANGGKLEASLRGLRFLLERALPGDEMALATFSSGRLRVDVPFTKRLAALEEASRRWEGFGTTALHDAVAWLPEIQLGGRYPKRGAVLVTDGVDNASGLTAETAREMVSRAELPVHVLALGTPPRLPSTGEPNDGTMLRLLARATGGGYYAIDGTESVRRACLSIAERLRHQYVLSFPTRGGEAIADHRLEVEVRRRGARVTHRSVYRGAAPERR